MFGVASECIVECVETYLYVNEAKHLSLDAVVAAVARLIAMFPTWAAYCCYWHYSDFFERRRLFDILNLYFCKYYIAAANYRKRGRVNNFAAQ